MPVMLTCKDASLDFPTKTIFSEVTLGISSGDRIGIVGANGDGKSTLLNLLARRIEPDTGQVIPSGNATIGLLGQRDTLNNNDTVADVLAGAQVDAFTWEASREARTIVEKLLGDVDHSKRVADLSGGQRRRCDLARLLIGDWDILMLDEPTNHLDIGAIHWLAEHLRSRWQSGSGALLVVTHDRWFLDEVCRTMWEVHDGQVDPFEGGDSAYVMQRVERDRRAALAKQKRENKLRKELAWLSRGAQARRSKPRFHLEAAQALIADVPEMRNSLELKQMAVSRLGKQVLELSDVCLDRGGQRILTDITWNIGPGDRIGILGENGAGKSSLLHLLNGSLRPTLGHIKTGRTVHFATLTQNLDELTPLEEDTIRVVLSRYKTFYQVEGKKLTPAALLERAGFTPAEMNARIKDLSGGQRRRLQLLLILLDEPNVLILDEPGNDLDTDMLAVTEDLLDNWPGTLIVVSHDRYFIERVTDSQFALIDGHIHHVPGGVDEYLSLLEQKHQSTQSNTAKGTQTAPHNTNTTRATSAHSFTTASNESARSSATHNARKTSDSTRDVTSDELSNAERHALRKQLYSLERKMKTQQNRVTKAQEILAETDPFDFVALGVAQAELQHHQAALSELEDTWLEISDRI